MQCFIAYLSPIFNKHVDNMQVIFLHIIFSENEDFQINIYSEF